jgi:protein-L-isoaspartate(D-aspartate) O-methyltransferase
LPGESAENSMPETEGNAARAAASNGRGKEFEELRRRMVEEQIRDRGIRSARVLEAMLAVPRHEFVPAEYRALAYTDQPLPIGEGQTISQPYMVAAMAEALELAGADRVLEVGAGSGYQAAVLALLAAEVYAIEFHVSLARAAEERLARLGYRNVRVRAGDGSLGWAEAAPFEAILVTAASREVPPPLVEQLSEGGRLLIPVGQDDYQELRRLRKASGQMSEETLLYCRFVPLLGRHGRAGPVQG